MPSKLPAMVLLKDLKKCVKGNQALNLAILTQVTHGETLAMKGLSLTFAETIGMT